MTAAVAILAGGRSSRMGQDKSLMTLGGKAIMQHVIDRVRPLHLPIMLITNTLDRHRQFGLPMYNDILPGNGSLGGLYTAVMHSPADHTLCVACDMPFLNPRLLKYLLDRRAGVDIVVPIVDGFPESLHAVYSKKCLAVMRDQIDAGDLKIIRMHDRLKVLKVEADTLKQFDPELHAFINVNTPADLDAIRGNSD